MGKVKEAVFSTFYSLGLYDDNVNVNVNDNYSGKRIRYLDIFSGSGSVGLESLSRGATHCTFVDLSDDCCAAAARNMEWCFGTTSSSRGTTASSSSSSSSSSNGNNNSINNKSRSGIPIQNYNDKEDETATSTTTPLSKTFQIVCADYLQALRDPASVGMDPHQVPYHIVTLCPPYEEVVYADLLEAVANSPLIGEDTVVLVEYPIELKTLPHVIRRTAVVSDDDDDVTRDCMGSSSTGSAGPGALIGIRNRKYGRTVIAMYVCNPTGRLQGAESRPEEFV